MKYTENSSVNKHFYFSHKAKKPSRQNQQNERTQSKASDQTGHLPSLIRVFAMRLVGE